MFIRTDSRAVMPKVKTMKSAGYDLCSLDDCRIMPGEIKLVRTGIALDQPYVSQEFINHYFALHIRSSIALKKKLLLANGVGVIDIDYPDEIMVMLFNPITTMNLGEQEPVSISAGERIAQLVLQECVTVVDYVEQTVRNGGFGSTGM